MSRRMGPVPLTCRLQELRRFARGAVVLGVWIAAPSRLRRIVFVGGAGAGAYYFGRDLGQLLFLADHVLAWDGARIRRLPGAARATDDVPRRTPRRTPERSTAAPYG
jgi:hypothetical protein